MNDRRVKYTHMVLKQALITLLADKPINKITTTEICALADVNRGTFYTHYTDQYDLLKQIQDDFADEVLELQAKRHAEQMSTLAMITALADYFREQLPLCRVLFTTSGGEELIAKLMRTAYTEFAADWPDETTEPGDLEMLFTFVAHGAAATLRQWVMTGAVETSDHVARLIQQTSIHGSASFRKPAAPVRQRNHQAG